MDPELKSNLVLYLVKQCFYPPRSVEAYSPESLLAWAKEGFAAGNRQETVQAMNFLASVALSADPLSGENPAVSEARYLLAQMIEKGTHDLSKDESLAKSLFESAGYIQPEGQNLNARQRAAAIEVRLFYTRQAACVQGKA